MSEQMLFSELLGIVTNTWVGCPDKPDETPEGTVRTLWFAAAGSPRSVTSDYAPLPPLDDAAANRVRDLVQKRSLGYPLAHLTGRQSFLGLEMLSGPEALIPRRETELLAGAAIECAREAVKERGGALVIDVGTGSGNLALAIATHVPEARVHGSDISADAVDLARRNAHYLKLESRVNFAVGDLFAPFENGEFLGQVDVVTCNPPYISSAKVGTMAQEISSHEPRLAFDGGVFGVDIVFRLVANAPRLLRPGSWLCFEVGLGQGPGFVRRIEQKGLYREVNPLTDAAGEIRAIIART